MIEKKEWLKVAGIIFSAITFTLLFALTFEVHAIEIDSCYYINSSGLYELNQSLTTSGGCFQIDETENVTLDCKGFSVSSDNTGAGINVFLSNNITIKNCNMSNFDDGLFLDGTTNIWVFDSHFDNNFDTCFIGANFHDTTYIENVTFNDCGDDGLNIVNFVNAIFKDIEVNNNFDFGIALTGTSSNATFDNVISNNNGDDGFRVTGCTDCKLINSELYQNQDKNIGIVSSNNFVMNNIDLYEAFSNYDIFVQSSDSVIIENIDFLNSTGSTGLLGFQATNISINDVEFTDIGINSRAIYLYQSDGLVENSILKSDNSVTSDLTMRCLDSICYVRNCDIDGDDVALISDDSFMMVNDTTTGSIIQVANNGNLELYNVTDDGLYISDSGSSILRFWNLTVINPDNYTFILNNYQDEVVINLTTSFTSFYVAQFNHTNNVSVPLTPHSIDIDKTGYFASQDSVTMDQDRIITLSLLAIPQTIAGQSCYTGNILAIVDGHEVCNQTGCFWNNDTVYKSCPHGCGSGMITDGDVCLDPPYMIYVYGVIIIVICMAGITWLSRR